MSEKERSVGEHVNPEIKRMETTALSWPQRAEAIVIADQDSYTSAAELLVDITSLERQVVEHHAPIKAAAWNAHKVAVAAEKKLLEPLNVAKGIIKARLVGWTQEQERIRLEAQRKAEEEARILEEEQRLQLAAEAEEAGAPEETVQEILEMPTVMVPVPVVRPTFQRAPGVSTSQRWKAQVVDIRALCRAVADGRASTELVQPNLVALNNMARAMKQTMNIPGVKAVPETTVAVRRAI